MDPSRSPLALDRLRRLTLDPGCHPRGRAHLSAASGLVCAFGCVYVIGDDEHHLAVYRDRRSPGALQRVMDGDLPHAEAARKRRKADLESLLWLPAQSALVALGSGSRPTRERAVRIGLHAGGTPHVNATAIDLTPLYAPLRARLGEINIEGAFVLGDSLLLLNRAHGGRSANLVLRYRLRDFIDLMAGSTKAVQPQSVVALALGSIDGVPLGLTDGAALPDGGWVFSAVAEDSESSYADGGCVGAAVGLVGADGRLQSLRRLVRPDKIEGIDVQAQRNGLVLFMVTDADDPDQAAWLLSARL